MSFAQGKQAENAYRHCNLAPACQVGDLVWLNARNIITRYPSVKLDHKQLHQFPTLSLIGKYAY
jgi:hypothetical protein